MKLKKSTVVITTALAVVAVGAGAAFATWSATGTGTGAAAATTAQSLVVTAITPTGAGATLYPGGPAGPVSFTVKNPNPYAVTITGVSWGTPTSTNTTACPSSDISLDPNAPTSVNINVPANDPGGTVYQISGVLDLAHSAGDGCQGIAFDIPVTVTGAQQ